MTNTEAIEAMKAQDVTDTNVGDMISRQAAIDTLKNHLKTTDVPASYPGIIRAFEEWLEEVPSAQPEKRTEERTETHACDCIERQAAIEAVGYYSLHSGDKLLFADKPLKALPSAQPTLYGYPIEHLALIARVLQKENLPPERISEMLSDAGRIVEMVRDEFEETLRKAVEQCMMT